MSSRAGTRKGGAADEALPTSDAPSGRPITYRAVFEGDGRPISRLTWIVSIMFFIAVGIIGTAVYKLHGAVEHQHTKASTTRNQLSSRDGFQAVKHCPEQLTTCRDRLSSCGEDAAGCQRLLTQCRRIAVACKRALTKTKTADLPRDWFTTGPKSKAEPWNIRPDKGWGLNKYPERPDLKCGKHGKLDEYHNICKCAILYGGPDCSLGHTFTYRLPGAWDHALKRKVPMRQFDARYSGDYILNKREIEEKSGMPIDLSIPVSNARGYKTEKKVSMGTYDRSLGDASPATDPLAKIFDQCAVVGNSGILLNFEHGGHIDSHEAVFRFNDGPTNGFEKYVGSKTTFRWVGEKFLDYREANETVLHDARSKSVVEAYKRRAYYTRRSEEPFLLVSPEFSQVVAGSVMEYEPTIAWKGILLALQVCRRVDLFGLFITELHGTPYHYYDTCSHGRDKVQQEQRDDREWILVRNLVAAQLLHFVEPCVEECRLTKSLCRACRARERRYQHRVHPEVAEKRLNAGRPSHCSKAAVHHEIANVDRRRRRMLAAFTSV